MTMNDDIQFSNDAVDASASDVIVEEIIEEIDVIVDEAGDIEVIDTEIEVTEKEGTRSVSVTKQRELPSKGETIYFRLEVVEMGTSKFGGAATTCVAIPDDDANATKPHKKLTKHDENNRTAERAWWASGAEERDGLPYVSRSALRDLLVKDGATERTAKNKTEASRQDGMISQMLNAGTLKSIEHGWIFINKAQASAMLMQKNGV